MRFPVLRSKTVSLLICDKQHQPPLQNEVNEILPVNSLLFVAVR